MTERTIDQLLADAERTGSIRSSAGSSTGSPPSIGSVAPGATAGPSDRRVSPISRSVA